MNSNLKNLKDMFVFDFYTNKEKNITKLGYRFIFQSKTQTLTDKDIDMEMEKIYIIVNKLNGVEIPGLQ